jgi:DNA-binding NarL/FixJ family response regulator/class 3 adenylate cyclase
MAGEPELTLLFTDIEDSTSLVDRLRDGWPGVLEAHCRLVREAVEQAGGQELDSRGEEFSLAFDRPGDAVTGALAIQTAHAGHSWPEGADVRVRIGLHVGRLQRAGSGYAGLAVHLTARICSAGHGGQILLSSAVRERVPELETKELGRFRLRGIQEPEHIFQLVAPGLPTDFPPLRIGGSQRYEQGGEAVRVVIADDSVLLREGIVRLLEDAGLEVVGQAGTAEELLLKVRSYEPDVAIVDIRMPPTQTDEGLRAAREIRERHPGVGVLVLSQHLEASYAMELLSESAEGVGYLLKDRVTDVDEFVAAVRRVSEGGSALDPSVVSQLVGRRRRDDPLDELTRRERDVLELMAEGRSNQAVANLLFVTPRAVEKHVTSIFAKLRLPAAPEDHRRVLAVLKYLRG